MLSTQPGLQPFLEGYRCHKLQEGLKSEFRAMCLCAGSSPESAGLQAAPRTRQLRYGADLACSSVHYNPGRCELRFPVCTGSVIVSAMTKGLFLCTTIPVVHRSDHCSHKKSVFLSAVVKGSSHAGSSSSQAQAEGVTAVCHLRLSPPHTPSPPHLLVLHREFCTVLFTNKYVLFLSGEGLLEYCWIQTVLLGLHGIF